MKKAPSFQFYPADYLTDFRLAGFTLAQHGAYFLLLSYDWLNDGLPDCTKSLSRLLRAEVSADIEDVLALFSPHPTKQNTITNSRLQSERENQRLYKEAQSANGKASAAKRGFTAGLSKLQNSQEQEAIIEAQASSTTQSSPMASCSLPNHIPDTGNMVTTPPKKTKTKKEISMPNNQQPDRAGNERKALPGFRHIHLSPAEIQKFKSECDRLELSAELRKFAVEKVDVWLEENPKKLAASSEHLTRILDWGIKAALEKQTTETRNQRAKDVARTPIGIETKGEREQRKARELIAKLAEEDKRNELKRNRNTLRVDTRHLA